ncbi:putative endodeoxyribonuclease [Corynebacterium phage P1201]|uniref:Putative endodeoxyribonuclease n=1 Tax=Corynebacterium phage P1201 TaxID=384848 RepID=A7IY95_9CAUD|nr:HNH endonuclease [Corynebacterium phage P1201]ABF57478.1 putative endodeoxyribonuclease [Corynebacterium phage P1201]
MEEWKDINGYEGYYQVSNYGRVRSLDRVVPHAKGELSRHHQARKQLLDESDALQEWT